MRSVLSGSQYPIDPLGGWVEAANRLRTFHREPRLASNEGQPVRSVQPVEETQVLATSPGVLLTSHPMRSTPIVEPGAAVKQGDVLGLLRIAQLCLPVIAPSDGVVVKWLVEPGVTVGYGTALMTLAPAGNL